MGFGERLSVAQRHVDSSRRIVEEQQQLIAKQKAQGRSSLASEALLSTFQTSLATFESDLAAVKAGETS
jgi:hypothetical protein